MSAKKRRECFRDIEANGNKIVDDVALTALEDDEIKTQIIPSNNKSINRLKVDAGNAGAFPRISPLR